jgi:bifunctional enzyme Fae/Hps
MLSRKQKYLQIAFNRTLEEIAVMINSLPLSDRIIIEAGYPLIKTYGVEAIRKIKQWWLERIFGLSTETTSEGFKGLGHLIANYLSKRSNLELQKSWITPLPYVVADLKCMDRAFTEVEVAASTGASAATCLGLAPVETINAFIKRCEELRIDSVLDMINVEYPFEVLSKLVKPPKVIMLHRGVDEGEENREKEILYHEIERIKDVYDDVLIAVAGGETIGEAITGAFNGADIIVVWRPFNENPQRIAAIANEFLKEIK